MPGWRITDPIRVSNVANLPRLAALCRDLGVRPTYLCTYPAVTAPDSAPILHQLAAAGDCELGTHLHPWNTPPFDGLGVRGTDERTVPYYMSELGPERFRSKLEVLHATIAELAGRPPISFRAGRFGIDGATLAELPAFGYRVDSSVTPLASHAEDGGPDFRFAPRLPYRPSRHDVCRVGDLPLVEIPVSVALTRSVPRWLANAYVRLPRATRLRGLLSRDFLGLVDYAWLYPARFDEELMFAAARTMLTDGSPVLNVFAHSSEYAVGQASYVQDDEELERCFERTRAILAYCIDELGAEPATLGEAALAIEGTFEGAFDPKRRSA